MLRAVSSSYRVAAVSAARFSRVHVRCASSYFTKEHEYARVDGKVATCGITNFAQSQLGDVVYVSLPNVGDAVSKGQAMASVESVKAASDVYAPVSGKVTEVNGKLSDNPALVNESAEGDAWFVKIELSAPEETGSLLTEAAYKKHCDEAAAHH